jgi:hypothetical protein
VSARTPDAATERRTTIPLTRDEIGYVIDAVASLARATDPDNPYPALLRKFQEAYRERVCTAESCGYGYFNCPNGCREQVEADV